MESFAKEEGGREWRRPRLRRAPSVPTLKRRRKSCYSPHPSLDMYAVPPSYKYPLYTSWVGSALSATTAISLIFYIIVTSRDYIIRGPEMVEQGHETIPDEADVVTFKIPDHVGLSVSYTDADGRGRVLGLSNDDAYFRYEVNHVTIKDQERYEYRTKYPLPVTECQLERKDDLVETILCLDRAKVGDHVLQGRYLSDVYQYVEIGVNRCSGEGCAPVEDIDAAISKSWVRVRLRIGSEDFSAEDYHAGQKDRKGRRGVTEGKIVEHRSFVLPNESLRHEVYMRGRFIQHESRHWGSPPMPEKQTDILSFGHISDLLTPKEDSGAVMFFFIRLEEEIILEETSYWMPTLLDLFGSWGALASFLHLSLGCLGRWFNGRLERMSFKNRSQKYAISTSKEDIDTGYEVVPDIRLFDKDHFNSHGRLEVSKEEFNIPTSVYGELRLFAVEQHRKKHRASQKLTHFFHKKSRRRRKLLVEKDYSRKVSWESCSSGMDISAGLEQGGNETSRESDVETGLGASSSN